MRWLTCLLLAAGLLSLPMASRADAQNQAFGLRGGIGFENAMEDYSAGEIYFLQDFSWRRELAEKISLQPRWEVNAGAIVSDHEEGGFLMAGLGLAFVFCNDALEFDIGFRPTWLSTHEFGDDDLGGPIQFTSHAGLGVRWGRMFFQYRVQHISNAGLDSPNPGLNLHMAGVGVTF